tara:strand:+ start:104 stop:706 length:603 start_codon:yes stop_codon:yes gene_type:complete
MPNNNKKPSPLTAVPPQLLMPIIKGGLGGFTSGISNVSTEFGQIKDEFKEKGYKDAKFGEKLKMLGGAAGRLFTTGNQAVLGGISQGVLGTDFGLSNVGFLKDNQPQQEEEQIAQQPTYSTNMMNMPMTMKPLKMLTPYKMSYVAKNMKASEAETAMKMQDMSGSSSLMFTEEGLNKLPDNIPGKFGDIVRKEKQNLKNK